MCPWWNGGPMSNLGRYFIFPEALGWNIKIVYSSINIHFYFGCVISPVAPMKPWSPGFLSVRKLMTRQQIDNWLATMQSAGVRHTQTCIAKPFQVVWSNLKSRQSINYLIVFCTIYLHIKIKSCESRSNMCLKTCIIHANNN